jgi:predicted DNA-binding transcriptional regulator YafY
VGNIPGMTRTVPRSPAPLAPVDLSPEEAAAVAVALAAQPTGPYSAAGRVALEKVLVALEPDPRRRQALLASTGLVRAAADESAAARQVVDRGLVARQVVVLTYCDGAGRRSRREVEPQLLARAADREYLVAWCRERQAIRWFRWDRVEAAELTGERAPRRDPASFGAPPAGRRTPERAETPLDRHPAGRARRAPVAEPRRGLVLVQGGRSGDEPRRPKGGRPTLGG